MGVSGKAVPETLIFASSNQLIPAYKMVAKFV
jgi:hypothetical protein